MFFAAKAEKKAVVVVCVYSGWMLSEHTESSTALARSVCDTDVTNSKRAQECLFGAGEHDEGAQAFIFPSHPNAMTKYLQTTAKMN